MQTQTQKIPVTTIGAAELAAILGKSIQTVYKDRGRNSAALPPPLRIPGSTRTRWLLADVVAWLEACRTTLPAPAPTTQPATLRRGAPTKAERLEAEQLGISVQDLRRQQ